MGRELKNATITHVSYVDKAANQKKFFLTKSADKPTFEKEVKIITKADDTQQLVYGIVYEPDTIDAHEDFMTAEEIEKAAHQFLKDARNMDTQHDFVAGAGEVVESYVAPADFEIDGETILKGSWVLVTKATEEVWEQIQKGEITGYSMAGTAEAIEKQTSSVNPVNKADEAGLFNLLKNFFANRSTVQKGAVRDKFDQNKQQRDFWAARESFDSSIRSYNWRIDNYEFEQDEEKMREAIEDYTAILNEILLAPNVLKAIGNPTEEIEKAGKKIAAARMDKINVAFDALSELKAEVEEEEEEIMKVEDITKAVQSVLEPITQRLEALEKDSGQPTEPQNDDVKQLEAVLTKALEPLNQRLEAVEKARNVSQQMNHEHQQEETPVQKGYLRHFG
ncbi:XkdF-like putative serine protease domain-containing protein [Metabacillus fastidiosus]|uniref:XkdF-like putative serine protease domain-containing protein n=1 Tax=Metabacillus fastidiosus TaxID=1458 RepID=UPI003D26DF66